MPGELCQFEDVEGGVSALAEERLDRGSTLSAPIRSTRGHGHDQILPDASHTTWRLRWSGAGTLAPDTSPEACADAAAAASPRARSTCSAGAHGTSVRAGACLVRAESRRACGPGRGRVDEGRLRGRPGPRQG